MIKFNAEQRTYSIGKRLVPTALLGQEAKTFLDAIAKHQWVNGHLDFTVPYSSPDKAFYGIRDTGGDAILIDEILGAIGKGFSIWTALYVGLADKWVSADTALQTFPHAFALKNLHSSYVPTITNLDISLLDRLGAMSIRFIIAKKKARNIRLDRR
ncbi:MULTISPECIES: hypothetical protein [unclassified Bradyrhizobium]|uniref:hypothetical protein n=1 Tax=unclassified Bradyrhizobium TaxID=2631580 RepID=UPI0033935AF3